jgi:hypothetical protein
VVCVRVRVCGEGGGVLLTCDLDEVFHHKVICKITALYFPAQFDQLRRRTYSKNSVVNNQPTDIQRQYNT